MIVDRGVGDITHLIRGFPFRPPPTQHSTLNTQVVTTDRLERSISPLPPTEGGGLLSISFHTAFHHHPSSNKQPGKMMILARLATHYLTHHRLLRVARSIWAPAHGLGLAVQTSVAGSTLADRPGSNILTPTHPPTHIPSLRPILDPTIDLILGTYFVFFFFF